MTPKDRATSEPSTSYAHIGSELDPMGIKSMQRAELVALQERLGYGNVWREWQIPSEWAPPTYGSAGARTIRLPDNTAEGDAAWTELLKFALIRSLVPGKKFGVPKPISVFNELRTATQIAGELTSLNPSRGDWWGRLTEEELILRKGPRGKALSKSLAYLHRQGYIHDCPSGRVMDGEVERNRKGEPAPKNPLESEKQWQPLPDEFTGQCGQRALWVIKNMGQSLLLLLESGVKLQLSNAAAAEGRIKSASALNARLVDLVRGWTWTDSSGAAIHALPFTLHIKRKTNHYSNINSSRPDLYEDFSWPPRTWGEVMQLVALLQGCHLWVLLLASGPRASTVLSYHVNCLEPCSDGHRLSATLYKTPRQRKGRVRNWPAPPVVVHTMEQQIRLANAIKSSNPDSQAAQGSHLWVQTHRTHTTKGGVGSRMHDVNDPLEALVRRFGIRHLLDPSNPRIHSHRFRKTLARIVALTLTNAQMILMDCFGHDDPEMTLRRYILSDPAIIADVQRVQRELVILMAQEAIESAHELGGAAGAAVRDAKTRYMRLHSKSSLDPQDVFELAEALTMQGMDWVVVMPGVICTLPVGFTGPCASGRGQRDPANCQSGCHNQILSAYHQTECDDMVRYIIEQLQRAVDEEADLMISLWCGQLNNWLYRWSSVFKAWASHPLVMKYGSAKLNPDHSQ